MRLSKSLLCVVIALAALAASVSLAENRECENSLRAASSLKLQNVRLLQIQRSLRLPGGRGIEPRSYRLAYLDGRVIDVDGIVERNKIFTGFLALMNAVDSSLADPRAEVYHSMAFKYSESSSRTHPVKLLFIEDFRHEHDFGNLSFVPTNETALFSQSLQTKALFKRLRQLRGKYALQSLPNDLRVAKPESLFGYFKTAYQQAIADLDGIKIKKVESLAELKANDLIDNLKLELARISSDQERKFLNHFVQQSQRLGMIDTTDLGTEDFSKINGLRSHLRAAITESFVAMRVPDFVAANINLSTAFERGIFKQHGPAMAELRKEDLLRREFDLITANGIYEVKSAMPADFGKASRLGFAVPPQRLTILSMRDQQIQRQEIARGRVVGILKKYKLVSDDFGSYMIYADGILQEDLKTTDPAYGVITLQPYRQAG